METASLIIKVDSRSAKSASADLDKLVAGAGKAERATGALTGAWKVLTTVAASAALTKAVGAYVRLADASANMSARLRLATQSQEEFTAAQEATFRIAQSAGTELEGVVNLYGRLAQASTQLGLSQAQVAQLTETVTQAFTVSGATSQEAAGGIRQLTQALAGGTLRAEEFNSIIESSPRIVQALADHFGVSFGKVRQLVNEGKISSEQFAAAMLSASAKIQAEFDQMPLTVSRATQQVRNALTGLVGSADEAGGASAELARSIEQLARTLESNEVRQGFATVVSGVAAVTAAMAEGIATSANYHRALFNSSRAGLDNLRAGNIGLGLRQLAFGAPNFSNVAGGVSSTYDEGSGPSATRDITLAAGSSGTRAAARSASADLDERTRARKELTQAERDHLQLMEEIAVHEEVVNARRSELDFERIQRDQQRQDAAEQASKAVEDLIAEMEFENSLIGKSLEEQQKMILLRYAGAAATEEQREAIRRLVEDGIRAREAEADMQLLRDGAKDLFRTIVTDSARASDALNRFFDNLKARMADKLFEGLLSGFAGMAGGGGWSGFLQGFGKGWSGARAAGGPVMAGSAYLVGEHGPELFAPGQSGRVYPVGAAAGGGNVQVQVNNYTGGQVRTREERTRGPDGTELRRLIVDVLADDLASGGKSAAVLRNRFGLREATS